MPMHDWTRVEPGIYHHFHGRWLYAIADTLNDGLLPDGYYAVAEQKVTGALGIGPDILTAKTSLSTPPFGAATAPTASFAAAARKRHLPSLRRLAIRHVSGDDLVALIELVSPANKRGRQSLTRLLDKLDGALDQNVHLAVIDPFPPGPSNPDGLHAALWRRLRAKPSFRLPVGRPLCAVGYRSDTDRVQAYIEPFAVGATVPSVPLYLAPDVYVTLPLEETYTQAFARVPGRWRERLTF